ncbi:hypothetical protein U9M48_029443, partial [Paspalum notatum var. saurae]
TGAEVVYSKYAGTEIEFNDSKHLILKEDDIIGVLETDGVKDMKPFNDRVLIKVAQAEDKTPGGLILTETTKREATHRNCEFSHKLSFICSAAVVAVGLGPLDEEGKRQPLSVSAGSTVLHSKYAGSARVQGRYLTARATYIVLRASDVDGCCDL